jgi:FixJ family two-component response regulator
MTAADLLDDREPTPPLRVCVVNEDAAVRVSLRFVFQSAGFEVNAYATRRGLLSSPSLRDAEGFVLDHKLRGADGLALARRLRALGLKAPIVLTLGLRCAVLETYAGVVDSVITAARIDEDIIGRLVRMIEETRGLRIST